MSKELVTIEHDRQAIYTFGSPYARKMLLPHVKRTERFEYLIGETKPNFPVPVVIYVAQLESATLWEYTGNVDDIRSRFPTRYRYIKSF